MIEKLARNRIVIIGILLLSACSNTAVQEPQSVPISLPPFAKNTPLSSPKSVATATYTPRPTITPYPTPLSTLPVNEKATYFRELYAPNHDCVLPCLWGLKPGESDFSNLNSILGPLGLLRVTTFGYGVPFREIGYQYLGFSLSIDQGILQYMQLYFSLKKDLEPKSYEIYKQYFFSEILTQYGEPSRTYIGLRTASADPGDGTWLYDMWLFYDEMGILVRYRGWYNLPRFNEDYILVCPTTDGLELIEFYLQHPNSGTNLEALYDLNFSSGSGHFDNLILKTWEETTDLSINDYYQMFSAPDNQTCFTSPVERW